MVSTGAIHFLFGIFTQSAIFDKMFRVFQFKTLITSKIEGAEWFTVDNLGPEGSIQATVFCFIVTIILLILSHKEGK
ncbi:MAG: hypothetical protein IPO27_17455 [Bacteroidetes bacterium]|nr:hypothetical protein [Bacteroidota bacterium]